MAAAIAHLARDEKLTPALTGCWLSIPSLLSPTVVPEKYKKDYLSREQNKDAPILNEGAIALFRSEYQRESGSRRLTFWVQNSMKTTPLPHSCRQCYLNLTRNCRPRTFKSREWIRYETRVSSTRRFFAKNTALLRRWTYIPAFLMGFRRGGPKLTSVKSNDKTPFQVYVGF
jgi:hypothetical protein